MGDRVEVQITVWADGERFVFAAGSQADPDSDYPLSEAESEASYWAEEKFSAWWLERRHA